MTACAVEDCSRSSKSKGWCEMHYARWKRTGQLERSNQRGVAPAERAGCAADGCQRTAESRGWCPMHHKRWLRTGDPLGRAGVQPLERFDQYHRKGAGCWPWTGSLDTRGYGIFTIDGAPVGAHRWSYEHHRGPIPEGMEIDHLCRVINCVNPDHLEPVTRAENMRRAAAARTHCLHGHPFDAENTRLYRGVRHCRACRRRVERRQRARART